MARHWQPQSRTCQPKNHPQEYRITNNRNNLHEHIYTKDAFTGHFIRTTNRHSIRGSVRAIVPTEAHLSHSVLHPSSFECSFLWGKSEVLKPVLLSSVECGCGRMGIDHLFLQEHIIKIGGIVEALYIGFIRSVDLFVVELVPIDGFEEGVFLNVFVVIGPRSQPLLRV